MVGLGKISIGTTTILCSYRGREDNLSFFRFLLYQIYPLFTFRFTVFFPLQNREREKIVFTLPSRQFKYQMKKDDMLSF